MPKSHNKNNTRILQEPLTKSQIIAIIYKMSEKIPKVVVLKPITPSAESVRKPVLEYPNLESATEAQQQYLNDRMDTFFVADGGSLEEERAAQQLAMQYMLLIARKLQNDASIRGSQQLWSERYTQASSEIYGTPEADKVHELAVEQASSLVSQAQRSKVDGHLVDHFIKQCEGFGVDIVERAEAALPFERAAGAIGQYIERVYQPVLAVLEIYPTDGNIGPEDIALRFEAALQVLAEQYDEDWTVWVVDRDEDRDKLSVAAGSKKIIVGMGRAPVSVRQLKGLFVHEILVHAQRAINGAKTGDERLAKGLPGYMDAEEGLGVFFEYAITGSMPEKNVDRYVDIGFALGMVDGKQKNRQQMLEFARTRAYIRNKLLPLDQRKADEQIEQEIHAHINRIYRGSLGNEYIGVFTKDIAYQAGFIKIGAYIETELALGKSIGDIMRYLLRGKFDPTNEKHVRLVEADTG